MTSPLTLAYSPCPNDTFIFNAIAAGQALPDGTHPTIHLHDVDALNRRALTHTYDITKLSCYAFFRVEDHYACLDAGAAFGFGCGPILVARPGTLQSHIPLGTIAVPGELTTAHLLLQLRNPTLGRRVFVHYNDVMAMVRREEADFGVVIHEGRFTYQDHGLVKIMDLGTWWERETGLPLPLGCIAARRSLGAEQITGIENSIRASLRSAMADPAATRDYVATHAAEISGDVVEQHIKTFVNDFSLSIGDKGHEALARMKALARERGLL